MSLVLSLALYASSAVCIGGLAWRVWIWAATPEPFRIPTTTGQQPSVAGIAASRVESPSTRVGVVGRMALEGLLFRSLFRNTAFAPPPQGSRRARASDLPGAQGAVARRDGAALVAARHHRPAPAAVCRAGAGSWRRPWPPSTGSSTSGFPRWYATDAIVIGALAYLLARRLRDPLLRYMTLPADYLALGLLSAIAGTGLVLRYVVRTDIVAVAPLDAQPGGLAARPAAGRRRLGCAAPGARGVPAGHPAVHQDGARPGRLAQPDAQPGERQPPPAPRQPVERAGARPRAMRRGGTSSATS